MKKHFLLIFFSFGIIFPVCGQDMAVKPCFIGAAKDVIARYVGKGIVERIHFDTLMISSGKPAYEYEVKNEQLIIKGNSVVALCHGFYEYLKASNQGMIAWSGKNIHFKRPWKYIPPKKVISPYRYHYYMNVVTHGYSTVYWKWPRWQQELGWMALHGMDMLMLNNAYEAIMFRVFKKIGLSDSAIQHFFTGPAFQPWNRMGNITGWDGPPPASWYTKQIALTHQVLDQMHKQGMIPIIQAFAGFVPKEITKVYPAAKITPLIWNSSFPRQYRCHILLPDSANAILFIKIGKLFVQEWEKEFGKGEYFLADCFNEMKVPRMKDESETDFQKQLAEYGKVVYQSLKGGDNTAVWTMQGWTFGYQRDQWNEQRLAAMVSKVPDDKVLFLDLANEYNLDFWHISPGWKYYKGYFGKEWIYSFIPNMGGKTPWNGILKTYAEAPITALHSADKGDLVGFGFAPEGIENNELVYELLSDMGWRDKKINLDNWLKSYCINRYGSYPEKMKEAYQCFLQSCYGTFTDHPRFRYQLSADGTVAGTVNDNPLFFKGVRLFLSCANDCKNSVLYKNDAIVLSAEYLSLSADSIIKLAISLKGNAMYQELHKAYTILNNTDRLLQSHPEDHLERWVNYAKAYGDNPEQKKYYAQDARRILTTWGPGVNDYAARMWAGLIRSYYVQRMELYYDAKQEHKDFNVAKWEDHWVEDMPDKESSKPFAHPIESAKEMINHIK